ncbi:hypothetical protein QBC38DRAFT_259085 [Podospora fimiseda]|uniref:MARVEL domain-containing protein n=1 Tax=Podospora fimiseda TaxID=252190 RepID=A0AAN7H7N8_9PEZI|nr:hypothetical protein QBC38DRAFT_259085 [Podospora fimiseda]
MGSSSLHPRGFFAYIFLLARNIVILALLGLSGLTVHFIISILRARLDGGIPGSLIGILILTSVSLLWSCFSWNGYTSRLLHYAVTYTVDILLMIPFIALVVVLAQPVTKANCSGIKDDVVNTFSVIAPGIGEVRVPGSGKVACQKVFAEWILMIVVSGGFVVCAGAVQVIHLRERNEERNSYRLGDDFSRDPSNVPGNNFFTQRPPAEGKQWDSFGEDAGEKEKQPYNYPMGTGFGQDSFPRKKEEVDGFSSWSLATPATPITESPILREYKPRYATPTPTTPSTLNRQPSEAARVYQGSRSFRRSSGIAYDASARTRSRQRGVSQPFDLDPRTFTPRTNNPS